MADDFAVLGLLSGVAMARNKTTSNAQRGRHLRGCALASAQII